MDCEKGLIFAMWGSALWMYEYTDIVDLDLISKVMLLIHKLSMGWNLFAIQMALYLNFTVNKDMACKKKEAQIFLTCIGVNDSHSTMK